MCVYVYVYDILTFQFASCRGVIFDVKCMNCVLTPNLICRILWWLVRDEERVLKARDLERLMRSHIQRGEMKWQSWALKVAACIKFSQWEAVVGCFIWKQ